MAMRNAYSDPTAEAAIRNLEGRKPPAARMGPFKHNVRRARRLVRQGRDAREVSRLAGVCLDVALALAKEAA